MSENCTTYAELKHFPAMRQMPNNEAEEQTIYTKVKSYPSDSNQKNSESSPKTGTSVPFAWCLAVVILSVSCFFLLLTTGVLGFLVFQVHQAAQSQEAPLKNVTEQHNSTLENGAFTDKPFTPGTESSKCKTEWSRHGKNCYYFSREEKNFEDSKKFCKKMDSTFLKIDDEEELVIIEPAL
ncbi:killer cell lectin-like receptor 2 [Microcebus murinus]|uniref:killer cell lectin-like receptor 2 n=1 Tax=Microcebus murinus TaxID=30608 RepID=UPI003F6AB300